MAESNQKRRLDGKVAIVTGAGRGIGRAEAMVLAREGARVVVNDLGGNAPGEGGKVEVAQRVVDEIRGAGGEAIANGDSVTTMEGAARIVGAAIETFGRLDILVNNAGIARPGAIWELAEEDWDAIMAVHLRGCYTMARQTAPIFRAQRSGVIISTSSESGLGHATLSAYAAARREWWVSPAPSRANWAATTSAAPRSARAPTPGWPRRRRAPRCSGCRIP